MRTFRVKKLSLPAIIIYFLLAAVAGVFLYYKYSYVPEREMRLVHRGVSTINNIAERIKKYEDYSKKVLPQQAETYEIKGSLNDTEKAIIDNRSPTHFKLSEVEWQNQFPRVFVNFQDKGEPTKIQIKLLHESRAGGNGTAEKKLLAVLSLDSFLLPLTSNEFFDAVVLHSVDENSVYFSDNKSEIPVSDKFDKQHSDSTFMRFGVEVVDAKVNSREYIEFNRHLKIGDQTFLLSGFLKKEEYETFKKSIEFPLLIIAIFITFILISAFPTLKVFVINDWERLKNSDALLSAIGLLATLFFTSLLVATLTHYSQVKVDTKKRLGDQAKRISDQLALELEETANVLYDDELFDSGLNSISDHAPDLLFHEMFETSDKGKVHRMAFASDEKLLFRDSTDLVGKLITEYVDLSQRDYIKKPNRNETITLGENRKGLYFETVYSYLRGRREGILSRKMDDNTYRVISFDIRTLMNTASPYAHGFAVLDREKRVLYSSKKAENNFRNLNTDIFHDGFIGQAISHGLDSTRGQFQYGKDEYMAFMLPVYHDSKMENSTVEDFEIVSNLNDDPAFYILTFANNQVVEWSTGMGAVMNSFYGLSLLFFSLIFLLLSFLFKINREGDKYFEKGKLYDLIYPRLGEQREYMFLIGLAFFIILMYYCQYHYGINMLWRVALFQIFLYGGIRTFLFAGKGVRVFKRLHLKHFYLLLLSILIIFIILVDFFPGQGFDKEHLNHELYFMLVVIIGSSLLMKLVQRKWKNPSNPYKDVFVRRLYLWSVFSWTMATLVIPLTLITKKTHELIDESLSDHIHTTYDAELDQVKIHRNHNYSNYRIASSGLGFKDIMDFEFSTEHQPADSTIDYISSELFSYCTGLFEPKFMIRPIAVETSKGHILRDEFFTMKSLKLLLLFFVLFFVVRYFLNRVVLNVPKELENIIYEYKEVKKSIKSHVEDLNQRKSRVRLLIVGAPRSKKLKILDEVVAFKKGRFYIDFDKNSKFLEQDYSVNHIPQELLNANVVVIRFWFPMCIMEDYLTKLKRLTRYLEEPILLDKKIVMLSDFTITQMEADWFELTMNADDKCATAYATVLIKEWIRNFREFVLPLDNGRFDTPDAIKNLTGKKDEYQNYLTKGFFSPIYFSIWNSLSTKERFLLFDLAEDGIMNTKDKFTLMKLRLKGLIKYNRNEFKLDVFSPGFALFIQHGVSTQEILGIEQMSKKKGSWGQIRFALILLIVALLYFLYTLNPNIFNALAGAVSILATVTGAISQLSGNLKIPFLGKGSQ